jgi:hypothetical protein
MSSMPMTCSKKQMSEHMEHLPMLIPRIIMSVNYKHIPSFSARSLDSICKQYSIAKDHATILCIQSLINSECLSHIDSLALFFLLLNIDTTLKESMMLSETEIQRRKLCNFYMNLHKHLVPEFMAVDSYNSCIFATRCSDAWSVA